MPVGLFSMAKKVLVIGLDGGTFNLIEPWVEEGRLPNLRRLMKDGVYADLVSSIQPSSEQAWACFMTGVNNGKHGIYGFLQERKGTHRLELISSRAIRSKSLWRMLSDRNKKVIVINVPVTYPPEGVNGLLVSGLMTPNEDSQFTYPPQLKEEIKSVFPGYTINVETPIGNRTKDLLRFRQKLETQVRMRGLLTRQLMRKYEWDFLMVVFTALDRAQHKFWENMQRTSDPFSECIFNLYSQIDTEMGEILSNIGNDTVIFVVSDHGFGPLHKGLIVNNLLKREGLLCTGDQHQSSRIFSKLKSSFFVNFLLSRYRNLPLDMQDMLKKRLGWVGDRLISQMTFIDIDWERTRAYGVGSGNVRVNLEGREPGGIVRPDEYDEVREQIVGVLTKVKDPETDEGIFREIYKREQIYSGGYLEDAPDIVPHYKDGYRGILFGPEGQTFASREYHLLRGNTGFHTMDGIFIACGPDIVNHGQKVADLNIVDVAPTILHCLDITPPPFLDGKVAKEIFRRDD